MKRLALPLVPSPAGSVETQSVVAYPRSLTLSTRARYAGTLRIRQTSRRQIVYLRTRGTIAAGTVACPAPFGVTCLSANRAPVALTSNSVRVVIPARPR